MRNKIKMFFVAAFCLTTMAQAQEVNSQTSPPKTNKEIVAEFFSRYSQGDVGGAFNLVDSNVHWWVSESLPFGDTYKTARDYQVNVLSLFRRGLVSKFDIRVLEDGLVGDGDMVAAEVESAATYKCQNGGTFQYHNKYHFKIKLKEGHFVEVKEYMDTLHLSRLFECIRPSTQSQMK